LGYSTEQEECVILEGGIHGEVDHEGRLGEISGYFSVPEALSLISFMGSETSV
jgi:hypothetical protein